MKKKDLIEWLNLLEDDADIFLGDFDEYGDRISERADEIRMLAVVVEKGEVTSYLIG